MAAIEDLTESLLTKEDIPTVLALTAEAGWNQTSADWLLMIREGHAICLRDQADRPVATALALPLGAQIGWISMVLVTAAWRRKGLATRLVHHCAAWLEAKGRHALLDATPAGQKVYERMGFKTTAKMTRWEHAEPDGLCSPTIKVAAAADLATIWQLDEAAFGVERPHILEDLAGRGPAFVEQSGRGFVLGRRGRHALQIGPIVADDEATALALLDAALSRSCGPTFIDAFDLQDNFVEALAARGFTRQRPFARMIRGQPRAFGEAKLAFAAAGPELG